MILKGWWPVRQYENFDILSDVFDILSDVKGQRCCGKTIYHNETLSISIVIKVLNFYQYL